MEALTYIKNAKYAFTLESELKKSVTLIPDEEILEKCRVRLYSGHFGARMTYLMRTNYRVIILKHYAFRPDVVVSVANMDITALEVRRSSPLATFFMLRSYRYIHLEFRLNGVLHTLRFYTATGGVRMWRPTPRLTTQLAGRIWEQLPHWLQDQ